MPGTVLNVLCCAEEEREVKDKATPAKHREVGGKTTTTTHKLKWGLQGKE